MRILLVILALLVSGCAAAPVECPVIIGPSQFEYLAAQIVGGGNGDALLLSPDFTKLFDGHPSTDTRFEYDTSGAQTTASYWGLEVFLGEEGESSPGNVTVGNMLMLHTSMPAGAHIEVRASIPSGTLLASGTMQIDQSGTTTSAVLVWENEFSSTGVLVIIFLNNVNGSTYMSDGTNITIGEIHFSESVEFPLKRTPKISWAQINKQRFTSSGLTLPVLQPQVRTLAMEFAPIAQIEAINDETIDMETVIYRIMQGTVAAFIPFITRDIGYYGSQQRNNPDSQKIRAKTAMLASFNQPPSLGMDGNFYWNGLMNVTESI